MKTLPMKWIALGTSSVVLLLSLTCALPYLNTVRNEGVVHEEGLSTQYESDQNELSTYISIFYEQVGVANLKSARMDSILTNAVTGRYGDEGFHQGSAFFSAIMESYPDLSGLDVYDKIADHVRSGREAFKNDQDLLLDKLRAYDTWRRKGIVRHLVIDLLGFPSDQLEARVGGRVVATGEEALEQMRKLVITESTAKAFEDGRMEPLDPNTR